MQDFISSYWGLFAVFYFIAVIVVTYEAAGRGWDGAGVFFLCLLISPLMGAILFSPYRQIAAKKENDKSVVAQPEEQISAVAAKVE